MLGGRTATSSAFAAAEGLCDGLSLQAMLNEVEDWQEKLLDPAIASELNFFEVTIASVDQPKLLSRLSEALVRPGSSQWCHTM